MVDENELRKLLWAVLGTTRNKECYLMAIDMLYTIDKSDFIANVRLQMAEQDKINWEKHGNDIT